jgi:DNA-binding response OmpR family regulator
MARFLVVDDDPVAVRGMALLLSDDGHDVTACTDAVSAVAALERESFDAVLTDHGPPRVDGHVVARAARKHHAHACVVVVSERGRQDAESLVEAGSCLVMDKPLRYDEIAAVVADCQAQRGEGAQCGCRLRRDPLVRLRRR